MTNLHTLRRKTVNVVMLTVTGLFFPPITAMITPRPSRRSGSSAAIRFSPTDVGSIVTWSAPAPRRFRSLWIVSADVPGVPAPSAYVPGQMAIVSREAPAQFRVRVDIGVQPV